MKKILIAAVCSFLAFSSLASEKDVKEKLIQNYPNMKTESVTYLPEVKLYEILMNDGRGKSIPLYTNENIDFLFLSTGELLNPKTKRNVTFDRDLLRTKAV